MIELFYWEYSLDKLIEKGFKVKESIISGDECILIVPAIFLDWEKELFIYRSSIWRKSDFHPISLSFRKFFN